MADEQFEQPSLEDWSTESMWDLNRKIEAAGSMFDHRVMNLNQKVVGDAQAQAIFWQNIIERSEAAKLANKERELALKQATVELQERQMAIRERQDQHALTVERAQQAIQHQATLHNIDYESARSAEILGLRTVEPKETLDAISETIADAAAKGAEIGARAMNDRTQTSAANVSELTAARQVADVNVLNTLAELAGIVQTMQTQASTTQASFQALSNQVAELVGGVQALMAGQKALVRE